MRKWASCCAKNASRMVDAKERDARQAIVEGGLKFLRETKPDEDHLELMFVACLPTVRAAAERLGPDISDQLER